MIRLPEIFIRRPGLVEAGCGIVRVRRLSIAAGWLRRLSRSHVRRLVVAAGLLATVTSTLSIYPHQLAYFNELSGGPEYGHAHLLHSNLDWGQDLLLLRHETSKSSLAGRTDVAIFLEAYFDPADIGIDCPSVTGPAGVQGIAGKRTLIIGVSRLLDPATDAFLFGSANCHFDGVAQAYSAKRVGHSLRVLDRGSMCDRITRAQRAGQDIPN